MTVGGIECDNEYGQPFKTSTIIPTAGGERENNIL